MVNYSWPGLHKQWVVAGAGIPMEANPNGSLSPKSRRERGKRDVCIHQILLFVVQVCPSGMSFPTL